MRKLQISGYGQKTRANILSGAVTTYRKKERAEKLGVQSVHRLGTHGLEARRRQRLTAKTEWFKPKKNDWKSLLAEKEKLLAKNPTPATPGQPDQPNPPVDPAHPQGPTQAQTGGTPQPSAGGLGRT